MCVCECVYGWGGGVKGFCVRIIRFNLSRGEITEDNVMVVNPLNQLLPSATFMSSTMNALMSAGVFPSLADQVGSVSGILPDSRDIRAGSDSPCDSRPAPWPKPPSYDWEEKTQKKVTPSSFHHPTPTHPPACYKQVATAQR